jgi:hypothetical protein
MEDFDALIDFVLSAGEIAAGASPAVVRSRSKTAHCLSGSSRSGGYSPRWTDEEHQFLADNLGELSETQIAAALGRSVTAIRIHRKRYALPAPSKVPGYLSARDVEKMIGTDSHKISHWIRSGLLPGRQVALDTKRCIFRIRYADLRKFIVNPLNWVYFDPSRINDPHLRRLVELRRTRWGDEWWDTVRVANHHGVTAEDVKRYIKTGRLKAIRTPNIDGRETPAAEVAWAHWRILRSEATRSGLIFWKGRGAGRNRFTPAAVAFLLLARAVGISEKVQEQMTGHKRQTISAHMLTLIRREPEVENLRMYGLEIQRRGDILFADWRLNQDRFPAIARSMHRFAAWLRGDIKRSRLKPADLACIRSVLWTWARWYARTPQEIAWAEGTANGSAISPRGLQRTYQTLLSWGVDPLAPIDLPE